MTAAAIPVAVSNLTPTFYAIVLLTSIVIGALVKVWPALDLQKRSGDASLRADLLKRVADVEKEMADERRECERALTAMRGELRAMHEKVDGLVRQLIAYQVAEARTLNPSEPMLRALDALDAIKGTGE